jgi:hypothetical protein
MVELFDPASTRVYGPPRAVAGIALLFYLPERKYTTSSLQRSTFNYVRKIAKLMELSPREV